MFTSRAPSLNLAGHPLGTDPSAGLHELADLPLGVDALVPGLVSALLQLLRDSPKDGMFIQLPRQHALLLVRRQISPRQIVEFVFDQDSGRFDCTSSLALPQLPPLDPFEDAGFLRVALQGLTGASTMTLMQAPPLILGPWQGWSLPASASAVVSLELDSESTASWGAGPAADRVHRKARL